MAKELASRDMLLKLKQSQESGDTGLANRAKENDPLKMNFSSSKKPNTHKTKKANAKNKNSNFKKKTPTPIDDPTTPYNFVPLNDVVVAPPLAKYLTNAHADKPTEMQNGFKDFIKDTSEPKYSGYFDVDIKNLTPLYIGGTEDNFFSDGKNYCIPGSALRGCIKNIFKIVTNSAMRSDKNNANSDVTDKHLYFRSFASAYKDFRNIYADRMTAELIDKKTNKPVVDDDGHTIYKSVAHAGFLVHKGKYYYICPAEFRAKKLEDIGLTAKNEFDLKNCPTCEWQDDHVNVFSGQMFSKKHYYKIYNPDWHKTLTISDDTINGYRDDKNRKGLNLLDKKLARKGNNNSSLKILKGSGDYDFIMPCFYVNDGDTVKHFGANPYYRIPYNESIADHIPENLRNAKLDFADAIFGNKECWGSRVYFEDSYLQGTPKFYDANFVKLLLTPNPTSFQFYLNPEDGEARHWDTDSLIRGYKFYWHKKMNWFMSKEEYNKLKSKKVAQKITPLYADQQFKGKIRFQNLDAVELGALAFVLSMNEEADQCFKLGMGKPIGMGTVKLTAKLYLQQEDYYTNLFGDNGFYTGSSEQNKNDFITKFKAYLKANLRNKSRQLYEKRLNDLHKLLSTKYMDTNNTKIIDLTRYMNIDNKQDSFIINKRKPLPDTLTIVQKFNDPKIK